MLVDPTGTLEWILSNRSMCNLFLILNVSTIAQSEQVEQERSIELDAGVKVQGTSARCTGPTLLKKGYKRSYRILCGIQASIEQQSESSSNLQASESRVCELNRCFQRASCCFSIPLKISQLQLRTNPLESQITMISFLNAQINHKFSIAMINSHTNSWARTTTTDHCSVVEKELSLNREYHPKVNCLLMTGALI
jgi:hypothetical protein